MMKKTCKRILSIFISVLLICACIPFAVFAEHTHVFSDVTVVEPGYVYGGYTIYRCAECGYSYTDDPTWPMIQPVCIIPNVCAAPGESVTVDTTLQYCSGLSDLILDLFYNENYISLTDVQCAEYGVPIRISDKALYFETIDPAVQEASLQLTFSVDADAPLGDQTVSMSGCGVSACAVDNGEQISLTAQSAAITVFRPLSLTVNAPGEPVCTGDTVQMTVDLADNTGVAGMTFAVHYDTQVLSLIDVQTEGMFNTGSVMAGGSLSMMPYRVIWDDAASKENHLENGTVLTLTFKVRDTAQSGTTNVWLSYDADDVLDVNLEPVESATFGAELTVIRRTPGDADGDGDADLADIVAVSRYLAGNWNVEIDALNADVNRDGSIDLKDVVLIRRYLAGGWGVVLV